MTLSLISLLSQDVTALWLLLKTSAGVSVLRPGFPRNERVCCGCVVRGGGGESEYVCGNGVGDKISWGGSGAVALLFVG